MPRMQIKIMGRLLGEAEDWDSLDVFSVCFYKFEANSDVPLENADCVQMDYEKGIWEVVDESGGVVSSKDIVPLLAALPKVD
jgi:hypothetical protein